MMEHETTHKQEIVASQGRMLIDNACVVTPQEKCKLARGNT